MTTCAECKFWVATLHPRAWGDCLLAAGDVPGREDDAPMQTADQYGDDPRLFTQPTFGCNAGEKK